MLRNTPIPVHNELAFPYGAAVVTEVTPVYSFGEGGRGEQQVDEPTGLPVYEVTVLDNDPELKGPAKAVKVKILSAVQPVLPPELPGLPISLRPVEFEGLTVKPYMQEFMKGRFRIAWTLTARGMRAPTAPAASNGSTGRSGKESAVTTV
jgi:hypothetical protein